MGLAVLWDLTVEHPDISTSGAGIDATEGKGTTTTNHLAVFSDKK